MHRLTALLQRVPAAWWFIGLFILMCCAYEAGRVLHLRPQPHHLWRQSDCISLAWNYYDTTWNLLEPAVFQQFSDHGTSGRSAGEFPILYWVVGMIWRVTGPSEFLYRLLVLALYFVGSLALYDAVRRLTKDVFAATVIPLLLFTSPAVAYFGMAFLTDVPALSMALVGGWWTVRHMQERRAGQWYIAALFFALGILLKASSGFLFIALVGVLALESLPPVRRRSHGRLLFADPLHAWAGVLLTLVLVVPWYVYARHYNEVHGGYYTFNEPWPIWHMSAEGVRWAVTMGLRMVVFQVFDTSLWIAVGVAATVLVFNLGKPPWQAAVLLGGLLVGAGLHIVLWFNALFEMHDYYFINPAMVPMALLIGAAWLLISAYPQIGRSRWLRMAVGVLLLFNTAYAAQNLRMRYDETGRMKPEELWPIYHEAELAFWNGMGWWGMDDLVAGAAPLRAMGILPTDKVYYPADVSINSPLVLMGQRGWTSHRKPRMPEHLFIDSLRGCGLRYLVTSDPDHWNDPGLLELLDRPMGRVGSTWFFDLAPPAGSFTEEVLVAAGSVHHQGPVRLDTSLTAVGPVKADDAHRLFPVELRGLQLRQQGHGPGMLVVSGRLHQLTDTLDRPALCLKDERDGAQVAMERVVLPMGRFVVRFPFTDEHKDRESILFVHNPAGRPMAISDLSVKVTHTGPLAGGP